MTSAYVAQQQQQQGHHGQAVPRSAMNNKLQQPAAGNMYNVPTNGVAGLNQYTPQAAQHMATANFITQSSANHNNMNHTTAYGTAGDTSAGWNNDHMMHVTSHIPQGHPHTTSSASMQQMNGSAPMLTYGGMPQQGQIIQINAGALMQHLLGCMQQSQVNPVNGSAPVLTYGGMPQPGQGNQMDVNMRMQHLLGCLPQSNAGNGAPMMLSGGTPQQDQSHQRSTMDTGAPIMAFGGMLQYAQSMQSNPMNGSAPMVLPSGTSQQVQSSQSMQSNNPMNASAPMVPSIGTPQQVQSSQSNPIDSGAHVMPSGGMLQQVQSMHCNPMNASAPMLLPSGTPQQAQSAQSNPVGTGAPMMALYGMSQHNPNGEDSAPILEKLLGQFIDEESVMVEPDEDLLYGLEVPDLCKLRSPQLSDGFVGLLGSGGMSDVGLFGSPQQSDGSSGLLIMKNLLAAVY